MSHHEPLEDSIGYLIAQVCKLHRNRASALLDEIGLHVGQEMVLCALWDREGVTQTELAEHLHVQAATVTNALQRLEKGGLVERKQDMDDQRVSRVYLTDSGRALETPIDETWSRLEEETLTGFTVDERVLLRRLLMQVYENLAGEA